MLNVIVTCVKQSCVNKLSFNEQKNSLKGAFEVWSRGEDGEVTLSAGFWRTLCFSLTALFIFHLNKHIWIDLRGVLMFTLACITVSRCLRSHNNDERPSSTSLLLDAALNNIHKAHTRSSSDRCLWDLAFGTGLCPGSFHYYLNSSNKQQWGMQCSCVDLFVIGSVLTFAFFVELDTQCNGNVPKSAGLEMQSLIKLFN